MSQTHPILDPVADKVGSERWMVKIFNNDHNTFDEVISILIAATGCDLQEAHIEAWEAHTFGQTPVHFDQKPVCLEIASTISSIGLRTEVTPEWGEA